MRKRILSAILAFTGFILSPASWWNDLLINFPISYILALPIGLINRDLFLAAFIMNYWLTNIAGLVLMHIGFKGITQKDQQPFNRKDLYKTLAFSSLYTILIVSLILTGVLTFPEEFLDQFTVLAGR